MRRFAVVGVLSLVSLPCLAQTTATLPCSPDGRLLGVARAALDRTDSPSAEEFRAMAMEAGLLAPSLRVATFASPDAIAAWLASDPRPRVGNRCAVASDGRHWAVAHAPTVVEVRRDASRPMTAVYLPAGCRDATLFTLDREGAVTPSSLDGAMPSLPAEGVFQIVGDLGAGPLALASWRVGGPFPWEAPPDDAVTGDGSLLQALNTFRRAHGVTPLRADLMLRRVASEHAETTATLGAALHSPTPEDTPLTRLTQHALGAERIAEVIAVAPSVTLGYARLLRSPSHRLRLLDPEVDAAGVGIARRPNGNVAVVVLLARHPGLQSNP